VRGLSEFLLGAGGRWMRSNGRASVYGLDHGPLQAFAMCGLVQDPCMVHGEAHRKAHRKATERPTERP